MTEPLTNVKNPVALVLGGGGARGVAHIGVLKVLQEEGVPIDMLVGTSIGAFGVALFGLEPDWKHVRDRTFEYLKSASFRKYGLGLTDDVSGRDRKKRRNRIKAFLMKAGAVLLLTARKSLVSQKKLREAVAGMIPDGTFADTKIPAAMVGLDLKTCEEVIIREGSLRAAALASASLAGFFPPTERDGRLIVDASPVSSVPVDAARSLGAAAVIAVDIRSELKPIERVSCGGDTVFRVMAIASDRANAIQIDRADVVISPGVADTYWSDFGNLDAHVAAGEQAARARLGEIRDMLVRLGRDRP